MSGNIGTYQQKVDAKKYAEGYEAVFGKKHKTRPEPVEQPTVTEAMSLLTDRGPERAVRE